MNSNLRWYSIAALALAAAGSGCSDDPDTDDTDAGDVAGRGGSAPAAGKGGGTAGKAPGVSGSGGTGAGSGGLAGAGGSAGRGGGATSGGTGGGSAGNLSTAGAGGQAGSGGGTGGGAVGGMSGGGMAGTSNEGGRAGAGVAGMAAAGAGGTGAGAAGSAGGGAGGGSAGGGDCPSALVGWATVSGDGVATTTGGGNAAPVRPTNASELVAYASDSTPRVIEISGTFDVPELEVSSNKTLLGVGSTATINGGISIRGYDDDPVSNVILRNLRVNGASTQVDGDAVQIYFAHHVWIDHVEIWDGPDGNLDMTHAVNWVTVSWSKFRYTTNYQRPEGESSDHRFSSLIGHSDNNAGEDQGRLKITFHHNWWAERVIERMPRVRFGQVHVFNNYFSSTGNNYCVRAGRSAALLIESNYFDGVSSPHQFNNDEDEATASITARDNIYDGTSGIQETGGGGPVFTSAPYAPSIRPAADVPAVVQACAGPR